jgi:hypothetical protein
VLLTRILNIFLKIFLITRVSSVPLPRFKIEGQISAILIFVAAIIRDAPDIRQKHYPVHP